MSGPGLRTGDASCSVLTPATANRARENGRSQHSDPKPNDNQIHIWFPVEYSGAPKSSPNLQDRAAGPDS